MELTKNQCTTENAQDSWSTVESTMPLEFTPADRREFRQQTLDSLRSRPQQEPSLLADLCEDKDVEATRVAVEKVFTRLLSLGVEVSIAEQLLQESLETSETRWSNDEQIWNALIEDTRNSLTIRGTMPTTPGTQKIIALVGPTGVGKTTTIAKLAAQQCLFENRKVGLITFDTYRVGATEQLRTYAKIIDVPIEIVSTLADVEDAIVRLSDRDVIFIDTAGRSPKDQMQVHELKSMLEMAKADEIHLVLSAVVSPHNLQRTYERFQSIHCTSVILSKVDEAESLGNLTPWLRKLELPISFVTNGQNVPNDLATADLDLMIRLLFHSKFPDTFT